MILLIILLVGRYNETSIKRTMGIKYLFIVSRHMKLHIMFVAHLSISKARFTKFMFLLSLNAKEVSSFCLFKDTAGFLSIFCFYFSIISYDEKIQNICFVIYGFLFKHYFYIFESYDVIFI